MPEVMVQVLDSVYFSKCVKSTKIVHNLTPERVPKYQNFPPLTLEEVPKYQNCTKLTPESVLQITKMPKGNHKRQCQKFP